MLDRLKTWQERRQERRDEREERLRRTWVSCWTFRRWKCRATVGFILLLIGQAGNSLVDRQRSTDGRQALAQSGNYVAVAGCNRDFKLYQKLRAVFEQSLAAIEGQHEQGLTTEAQYQRAVTFYREQLTNFALPDCREVSNALSDDLSKTAGKVPQRPLYPGAPEAQPSRDNNPQEGRARPLPRDG